MVFPHTFSATFIMETPTALQTINSENPKTGTASPYSRTEIDILAYLFTGDADAEFYIDPYGWLDAAAAELLLLLLVLLLLLLLLTNTHHLSHLNP